MTFFLYGKKKKMYLDLSHRGLKSLKEYFLIYKGINEITELNCSHNHLTNLEGCPESVIILYCSNNRLASLQGCPKNVIKLYCYNNKLTTLQRCPKNIKFFYYSGNPLLEIYHNKDINKIYEINFKIDNFIKNVKKEKCVKSFIYFKDLYLQDFYKPDGMYVQLTDIYFS